MWDGGKWLQTDGRAFLTSTVIRGRFVLHACVLHHGITYADVRDLLSVVREIATAAVANGVEAKETVASAVLTSALDGRVMRDNDEPPVGMPLADATDRDIVAALARDGRLPFATIASEVGISPRAVRQRVDRLRATGVIRVTTLVDGRWLPWRGRAIALLTSAADAHDVVLMAARVPEVVRAAISTGRAGIVLWLAFGNDAHLLSAVNDRVRTLPGVQTVELMVVLQGITTTRPRPGPVPDPSRGGATGARPGS